jgi:hypothetical protein
MRTMREIKTEYIYPPGDKISNNRGELLEGPIVAMILVFLSINTSCVFNVGKKSKICAFLKTDFKVSET